VSETILIWSVGLGLFIMVSVPFVLAARRRERTTDRWEANALEYGLREPISLHPVIDPALCIGTGNCVSVCPEIDVIGFRSGQALAIAAAKCIGHGLCERSCPMEAIQLVFGTEKRGVELPRVKANFETDVPGLFIIGELGGMGLIRNAFEQGRQCIEGIVKEGTAGTAGSAVDFDVLIVGCGPAGLSASLVCQHHGLRFKTIEREDIGGTVRHYPRKKLVMTEPVNVPGFGSIGAQEIIKEDLVDIWSDIVSKSRLEVNTGETVQKITPLTEATGFEVRTDRGSYRTERVVLAIGRRGVPRKLAIRGEHLPNVLYSLREAEAYQGNVITVVGGGDSAAEAAVALSEQTGNRVRLSYRKDKLSRVKQLNREKMADAIEAGRVEPLWSTQIVENRLDRITVRDPSGKVGDLRNDHLFVFIGGELPTPFLKQCGIAIDTKFGEV
jgi:thioredoxin reductase/Pyruvate/2-oxoacid:ferredoxin oxidoreductase delta subunit